MNFSTLDVSVNSACIAVGTGQCNVPEPASFGLVGVALLGALAPAALRRRKSS
jgi:MYXO-CTERM domain-containing protein